jgi:hypothetical protein
MRSRQVFHGSSAGLSLALLGAALASAPAVAAQPEARAEATPTSGEAIRMYRDPQTGELRAPTAQELAAQRGSKGPVKRQPLAVKSHGGGMVSAVVGDRALEELVARKDASGKLVIEHAAIDAAPRAAATIREVK